MKNRVKRVMGISNKPIRFIAKASIGLAVIFAIGGVYGTVKARWAKKQVESFAALVTIGEPIAGLGPKAKEMHLNYRIFAGSNDINGRFSVWEGFAFARWFCDVEYQQGKALKKKIYSLD